MNESNDRNISNGPLVNVSAIRFRALLSFYQICGPIVQINIQFIDAKIVLLAIKSIF